MSLPLLFLLPVVAFLYAAVGHGGASGYLAVMAFAGAPPETIRPTALLLNLAVSGAAFVLFRQGGHFRQALFRPLVTTSVPFAFLGGLMTLEGTEYRLLLGAVLLLAALRFALRRDVPPESLVTPSRGFLLASGVAIGLLSGMIGIGGGVLLSPLLLLKRATTQKETAAIGAPFIFVNSAAGLLGQWAGGLAVPAEFLTLGAAATIGGVAGAWLGALRFPPVALRLILSVVLALAGLKLMLVPA